MENKKKIIRIDREQSTLPSKKAQTKDILKLKRITISGYKSIASTSPISLELGDVNILLGANGSGKSNIISFFKMLNFMMSGSFQAFIEKAGTSQLFLHYGSQVTSTIKGGLYFESNSLIDDYEFELSYASPDRLIISSEKIVWGKKNQSPQTKHLEAQFKESALTNEVIIDKTSRILKQILSNCKVYQFHDSSSTSPLRQATPIETVNYLQSEGNNLASFLYKLKKEYLSNYVRIVSYVKMIMPQFGDFYLEPNNKYIMLKWKDISPTDYVLLPEQFSDGTLRFIALATLLLQPVQTMPKVIVIDEPELGLHPFAINQLGEMIREASKHTQVIVATQSPQLVDEFEANQIIVIDRDSKKGCTTVNKLSEEELKDWLVEYNISDLWNKNIIGGRP